MLFCLHGAPFTSYINISMKAILIVAIGSGLGGALRFGMQLLLQRFYPSVFPLGTLSVNIIGCFLIGIFFSLAEKGNVISPEMKLLLISGFCGGFTTFSAFSIDNISLLNSGRHLYFCLYMAGSVLIGIAATLLGMYLGQIVLNR